MKIVYFPSTKLKKDTAAILNLVAYGDTEAIIERHGEPIVKITSVNTAGTKGNMEKKLSRYFGSIPDFPDVIKSRHFRKRNIVI